MIDAVRAQLRSLTICYKDDEWRDD